MKIGFTLPQFGRAARESGEVARFAREAEQLGADGLWTADRLLAPVHPTVGYAGGDTVPEVFRSAADPFALMSAAAAVTERVEIGANVLVGSWYQPAVLARMLTTIDRISGGRLLPGFGTGWSPEEYAAAGVPMGERGARLDECLDAMEALWTQNPAEYEGKHWTVPPSHVELKPVQAPRPPVYLGGQAPVALRRTARRADGWLPVHVPEMGAFDATSVEEPMERIRGMAEEFGRDPQRLGTVLRVYPMYPDSVDGAVEAMRRAEEETCVDHAFLETMNVAGTVDEGLGIVEKVLRELRG